MKTKSPLVLMEQLVMILVFALAAAICLRMFVLSNNLSKRYAATDRAVLEAQTAAEQLKYGALTSADLFFDADWNSVSSPEFASYHLSVTYEEPDTPCLWSATVTVRTTQGNELIALPVRGQTNGEVSAHG